MTEIDAPLTEDQQLLMAYVDDEMTPEERATFERRLAETPELASEVANFQCLADVTTSLRLAEPTDHEMQRFWGSFYNRSEWQVGWILLQGETSSRPFFPVINRPVRRFSSRRTF